MGYGGGKEIYRTAHVRGINPMVIDPRGRRLCEIETQCFMISGLVKKSKTHTNNKKYEICDIDY